MWENAKETETETGIETETETGVKTHMYEHTVDCWNIYLSSFDCLQLVHRFTNACL